ncbi:hypothetical protein LguiA_033235 [Lonicera macranthoides]
MDGLVRKREFFFLFRIGNYFPAKTTHSIGFRFLLPFLPFSLLPNQPFSSHLKI